MRPRTVQSIIVNKAIISNEMMFDIVDYALKFVPVNEPLLQILFAFTVNPLLILWISLHLDDNKGQRSPPSVFERNCFMFTNIGWTDISL